MKPAVCTEMQAESFKVDSVTMTVILIFLLQKFSVLNASHIYGKFMRYLHWLLACMLLFLLPCTWPRGYKTFFMLNSAETKIYPAHKC